MTLMSSKMPAYKTQSQRRQDDPRVQSAEIHDHSENGGGEMKALFARPAGVEGKLPGIVVVHENRGLNPYIEDVCRRAALAGFVALAPDALTPLGG